MEPIRASVAKLADGPPLVAVLAGGTTGIGSYVAKALAVAFAKQGSKLRVYIVGRNASRAEKVLVEGRKVSPGSDWRFIKARDLALISEVDRCCADITRLETEAPFHGGPVRVDLLYMTHGYPILKKPTTTEEGLDAFLSMVYYSRIRFIAQLMPLITGSPISGRVVSVYAGSMEDGTKPGESPIGLPPPQIYNINAVRKYCTFMKTFMFEEFAERHAGKISLTHIFPGLVDGPTFTGSEMPFWFRALWRVLKPVLQVAYMTSPDDCGMVLVHLASERYPAKCKAYNAIKLPGGLDVEYSSKGEQGGGCYSVSQRGGSGRKIMYELVRTQTTSQQVWDHTMSTLEGAEKKSADTKATLQAQVSP